MRSISFLVVMILAPLAQAAEYSVRLNSSAGPMIAGIVDTTGDTFRITSWTDGSVKPQFRIPMASQLPLTLQAFTASGSRYNLPDTWNGNIGETAGWAFFLPVDQDLTTVQWIQGQPIDFWRKASFGWGGLRNSLGGIVLRERDSLCYLPYAEPSSSVGSFTLSQVLIARVPEPGTIAMLTIGVAALRLRPRRR